MYLPSVLARRVVTGVRFIVQNRILYLQVKQGTLLPNWQIARDADWKPVEDISEQVRVARLGKKLRGKPPGVKENVDFVIITVGKTDSVQFDDIQVPHKTVLTGREAMIITTTFLKQKNKIYLFKSLYSGVKFELQDSKIGIAALATKFVHIRGLLSRNDQNQKILPPSGQR